MMALKIESIEYGWFLLRIGEYYEEASDYLGYDMPKELLSKTIKLLKGSAKEWVYIMDEPGAGIISLSSSNDNITISSYNLNKESFDLNPKIEEEAENIKECNFSIELSKVELLDSLVTDFSLYETGNGRCYYETNWMEFPQSEYNELKKMAFEVDAGISPIWDTMLCTTFLQL